MALPIGAVLTSIHCDRVVRGESDVPTGIEEAWLPALVQSVPEVVPEWLEAAAEAAHGGSASATRSWSNVHEDSRGVYLSMARAAVAAADKARGIVNSPEEFGQLPYASRVVGPCVTGGYVRADYLDPDAIAALAYPAIVYPPVGAQ